MGILLNSGGMDSFFVLLENRNLQSIFVDVGHKYVEKEARSAAQLAQHFGTIHQTFSSARIGQFEHSSGIIPFRNSELILAAAQYDDNIYMGVLHGEINSDKSPEFFAAIVKVLDISHQKQYWTSGRSFRIHSPLADRTKTELVAALWRDVKHNAHHPHWRAMHRTVSCYNSEHSHCGRCPSCFKRWVALTAATGIDHGDSFYRHPASWQTINVWRAKGYARARMAEIEVAYASL